MGTTKAQAELEQYLDGLRELEERREAGAVDRLNYLIIRNHRESQLAERSYVAYEAVEFALQRLKALRWAAPWGVDREGQERRRAFIRANLGPLARKLLEAFETVSTP